MNKYLKGFIFGILGLAVVFCLTVLIMGSINNRNFVDEIKSWGQTEEETVTPDNENTDTGEGTEEGTDEGTQTESGTGVETTAFITVMSNNNFRVAL